MADTNVTVQSYPGAVSSPVGGLPTAGAAAGSDESGPSGFQLLLNAASQVPGAQAGSDATAVDPQAVDTATRALDQQGTDTLEPFAMTPSLDAAQIDALLGISGDSPQDPLLAPAVNDVPTALNLPIIPFAAAISVPVPVAMAPTPSIAAATTADVLHDGPSRVPLAVASAGTAVSAAASWSGAVAPALAQPVAGSTAANAAATAAAAVASSATVVQDMAAADDVDPIDSPVVAPATQSTAMPATATTLSAAAAGGAAAAVPPTAAARDEAIGRLAGAVAKDSQRVPGGRARAGAVDAGKLAVLPLQVATEAAPSAPPLALQAALGADPRALHAATLDAVVSNAVRTAIDSGTGTLQDTSGSATALHGTGSSPSVDALAAQRGVTTAQAPGTQVPAPALSGTVGSLAWRDQLAGRVSWMIDNGDQQASLRLSPENLGPLEVRIAVREGEASVWFGAAQPETRAALEQAMPRLREMLASSGLALTNSGVFSDSPRDPYRALASAGLARASVESGVADQALDVRPARVARGLLDLYA